MDCYDSRWVFRRMRQALEEFRDSQDAGVVGPSIVCGDVPGEDAGKVRQERLAESERGNWVSRETVETQEGEPETLGRRGSDRGERGQPLDEADAVDGRQRQPGRLAFAPAQAEDARRRRVDVGGAAQ